MNYIDKIYQLILYIDGYEFSVQNFCNEADIKQYMLDIINNIINGTKLYMEQDPVNKNIFKIYNNKELVFEYQIKTLAIVSAKNKNATQYIIEEIKEQKSAIHSFFHKKDFATVIQMFNSIIPNSSICYITNIVDYKTKLNCICIYENTGDRITQTTYNKDTGECIDVIEYLLHGLAEV